MATAGRIAADLVAGGTAVILLEMWTKHGESPNFIWGGKKIYTPKNSTGWEKNIHPKKFDNGSSSPENGNFWKAGDSGFGNSHFQLRISTSSKNMTRGEHGSRGIGMMGRAPSETHQISPGIWLAVSGDGRFVERDRMDVSKETPQKLRDTSRYVWYLFSDV